MATVNKSSLRAEFDALKARFESLCAEGKMSADSRALVDALLMRLARWTPDELRTREGKLRLKRWLRGVAQEQLFEGDEARITRIFLDPMFLQLTGA